MKPPLSDRLLACCAFVHPGDRVADVGCDHGYLSIHLLQTCVASHVHDGLRRHGRGHHDLHSLRRPLAEK